ncbi:hypothetical protein EDC01DRAFT_392618 [Geopyxis carbonaria]|nr:hypothetical protein EDC01DRAFT_392618 [Geopyxis carbonaria]
MFPFAGVHAFYSMGVTLALLFTFCLSLLLLRWRQQSPNRRRRDSAGTPPRTVSPGPEKGARPTERLAELVTKLLPSPNPSSVDTPSGPPLPITDRTPEEIAAFGRFPDYAAISGVPLPQAYPNFDIDKALPRPYRPIRWAYHQTMSFKKMEPDWWLELENTYRDRIAQRVALFEKHGKGVLDMLPGSEAACTELMEMALQFVCARYPQYFILSAVTGEWVLINRILSTTTRVHAVPPLHVLLHNIPEDFCLTLRDASTGLYHFRAGVVCSSLDWSVATKIGLALHEIHQPVPHYAAKMSKSMDRFFTRLPTSSPIQRGSWGLERGKPLHMPPGDPHSLLRAAQDPALQLAEIHLRVDWQTLRRLPLSGSVVFNFKALFTPLHELRAEPGVPRLMATVLRAGDAALMRYKGTWHVQHVALPVLEEWAREQRGRGVGVREDGEEEEVATLEEYPLFGGWREKWVAQQGFE